MPWRHQHGARAGRSWSQTPPPGAVRTAAALGVTCVPGACHCSGDIVWILHNRWEGECQGCCWKLSKRENPQDGSGSHVLLGFGADGWCLPRSRAYICLKTHYLKGPIREDTDISLYNSRMPSESHAKIASFPLSYTKPHHYPAPHLARNGLYWIHWKYLATVKSWTSLCITFFYTICCW